MAHHALHYRYHPLHQDIICAETAIATLPATVDALGASRAMITCGPTILRACNVVPRVQEALGSRSAGVYAGVRAPCARRNGRRGGGDGHRGAARRLHQCRRRQYP